MGYAEERLRRGAREESSKEQAEDICERLNEKHRIYNSQSSFASPNTAAFINGGISSTLAIWLASIWYLMNNLRRPLISACVRPESSVSSSPYHHTNRDEGAMETTGVTSTRSRLDSDGVLLDNGGAWVWVFGGLTKSLASLAGVGVASGWSVSARMTPFIAEKGTSSLLGRRIGVSSVMVVFIKEKSCDRR
jgi:hypothetical protein